MPVNSSNENFFGIFGLNDVRTSIITSTPTVVSGVGTGSYNSIIQEIENWSQNSTYGWYSCGVIDQVSNFSTQICRIDFSNDTSTASNRTTLGDNAIRFVSGVSNSYYGWFCGGATTTPAPNPVIVSSVRRLDFSNDSLSLSSRGPLSSARYGHSGIENSNYAWNAGGRIPGAGSPVVSTIERMNFLDDSQTSISRANLSNAARALMGPVGNNNYGWFGGGLEGPTSVTRVDRIDYSNDSTTASVRGPLSTGRDSCSSTDSTNYGWFTGGFNPGAPIYLSTIERIDFSNDSTTASVRGNLTVPFYSSSGAGNNSNGWHGGGTISPTPGNPLVSSYVQRIDYSNDSATASVRGPLAYNTTYHDSFSGQAKSSSIRPLKGGNFGWFGGSQIPAPVVSTIERIDFSNDSSIASVRGPLSTTKGNLAATANSNYGWFGGGSFPIRSTVDRIDFSNDSAVVSIRGPLSSARYSLAATGNSNYGWFGGGRVPLGRSTVDRIDYANDFSIASVRGPLSSARYRHSATGNSNYGWFGSGNPTPVDRIDFSNDSAIASVRGTMIGATNFLSAATANSNYGWFGGGGSVVSTVQRIDFSNDSGAASVRGPLSLARQSPAAAGNSNYGWFGGGSTGTVLSIVDRINFSNDSLTASVRGPLNGIRQNFAATSNTPIG